MTIATALDKLNDKLAGSDQPASQTIEGMILRIIDNIDNGGGGGGAGVTVVSDESGTLDKTFKEIADAFVSGGAVIKASDYYSAILYVDTLSYALIVFGSGGSAVVYSASDEDSYPVLEGDD